MIASGAAWAQATRLPGAAEPPRTRPLPDAPVGGDFDFSIETPRRSPVPRAVDELRFELKDINIVGVKVFAIEELRPLWAPLIGKQVGLGDILNVADAIEGKYRERGYILSRAYVPPQRVGNGVFTINVVEGYVNALAIEGGDAGVRSLVTAYVNPVLASRPLELAPMERGLLLSNDLPGVQASGLLRPSPDQPGASDLVVSIDQTQFNGGLSVNNRGSQFTDLWTLIGDAEWNSPLGDGDQLSANVQSAPDPTTRIQGTMRYQHPVFTNGMTVSGYITVSTGAPAGGNLNALNLTTNSLAIGPRLSYPIIRSRAQNLSIDTGVTYQDSTINSIGTQLTHDHWRVYDVALTYSQVGFLRGSTSITIDAAQGLPWFGATENGSTSLSRPSARTDFTKFVGSLKRIQVIWGGLNFALNAQGQYSFAPLVSGEQIAFGGDQTSATGNTLIGRGYEPSAITGDSGIGGSFELRYDTRYPEYRLESIEPYVFFDTAKIWNKLGTAGLGNSLASYGAGLRLTLPYNIMLGGEYAQTLVAVPGSDNGKRAKKGLLNASIRF
ncbi:MAG TPA: ShlB/FhaC/HecB family hemolysin secretion/activation protein [Stellaceae bacterium]|nr:ShlB/FhaC/HecB family hemolysin secretion/activation protein [Stellaceae bacterium]